MRVPTAAAVDDPRQMPALRQQLLAFAADGGAWLQTERERALTEVAGFGQAYINAQGHHEIAGPRGWGGDDIPLQIELAEQRAIKSIDWYRRVTEDAQLVYVTPNLVDVIEQVAAAVPDDLTLTLDDLPTPCGLVVLGRPMHGTDAGPERPGQPVHFDGLIWGTARLPPADTDWMTAGDVFTETALAVGFLRFVTDDQTDSLSAAFQHESVRGQLPIWVPLGRSDWPYGKPVVTKHRADIPDTALASMVEDRRVIAALFHVLNERRLVHVQTWEPMSKQAKRRAAAKGYRGAVKIIHLRRTEYVSTEPHGEGRRVGVRFPVRPFFRDQPCGPGRTLRRRVLVIGHWRGPEGAPVVHAERVWQLDR